MSDQCEFAIYDIRNNKILNKFSPALPKEEVINSFAIDDEMYRLFIGTSSGIVHVATKFLL